MRLFILGGIFGGHYFFILFGGSTIFEGQQFLGGNNFWVSTIYGGQHYLGQKDENELKHFVDKNYLMNPSNMSTEGHF